MRGKVKWYDRKRGYGFVSPETGGPDVFVHISALPEGSELFENDVISFEPGPGRNGKPMCTNVRLVI